MAKYFTLFTFSVIHSLRNYQGLIGLSLFLITCLLVFAHLWQVAAAKIGAAHLDPDQLLWYIALNEWVLIAFPEVQEGMEQDVKRGRLAYLLPRPISYLGATFAEGLGTLSVHLGVLGLVAFLFTWWRTGIVPFDIPSFCIIIVLGLLAGIVAVIFQMVIGLSSFWLQEVAPCNWIWEKLLFALGGLLVPLSLYPSWIQSIAAYTPFPAILGQRSALAIHFSLVEATTIAATLILWGILGGIALQVLYRRGTRILHIEGG